MSNSPMNIATVDNIAAGRILIKILTITGLWPWHHHDSTDCNRILEALQRFYRYLLHVPLTFTFITLMWIEAFFSTNFEQAGSVLYMCLTETALILKIFNIWWKAAEAWQFMHEVANSPAFTLRTHQERDLWQREHAKFRRLSYCHIGGSIAVISTAYAGVLLVEVNALPYAYYVPFDVSDDKRFWWAYAYDVIAMTLTCISNATLDIICCYFMFHVALLYKLIGMRLRALEQVKEKHAVKELLGIFKLHQRVKCLTLRCESLISLPILSQIILSALVICFSAYRLQSQRIADDPGQFVAMLQFLAIMFLQIFLPCYYGNEITVNSNLLTDCVYNCNWLEYSVHTRKLINIYMEFLKRPIKLKAGNFFDVGLPIFTKTINNSYSLLAVLMNMSK